MHQPSSKSFSVHCMHPTATMNREEKPPSPLLSFFQRHWFLIGLGAVLAVGVIACKPLEPIADAVWLRQMILVSVLFIMALPLETSAARMAIQRPQATILAFVVNLGLIPLMAWAMKSQLDGPLALGLMVVAATPCTLAGASVWTRRAGGNDAIAMLVTISTNLLCFLITPFWLLRTTGSDVEIDPKEMILKLALLVMLPILVAQVLRQYRPLGSWATEHKNTLSSLALPGILLMVLIGAVASGRELASTKSESILGLSDWTKMIVAVVVLHLAALALGHLLAHLTGMSREDRIAVGFAGSQKTLMVGLPLAITYYGGLAILPMVAYHIGQLLFDTILADWLLRRGSGDSSAVAAQPDSR